MGVDHATYLNIALHVNCIFPTGVGQLPALMALADSVEASTPEEDESTTANWALAALAAPIVLGSYGRQPESNSRAAPKAVAELQTGTSTLTDPNLGTLHIVLHTQCCKHMHSI